MQSICVVVVLLSYHALSMSVLSTLNPWNVPGTLLVASFVAQELGQREIIHSQDKVHMAFNVAARVWRATGDTRNATMYCGGK